MNSLILKFYCLTSIFGVNDGIHTKIHNYWFTMDDCGTGRESQIMDNKCFDWHSSQDELAMIRWGRHARAGEFPWIVEFGYYPMQCTASIVNPYWLITAAHCFYGKDLIDPSFNHTSYGWINEKKLLNKSLNVKLNISYVFSHPDWDEDTYHNDLALIRLKEPIDLSQPKSKRFRELNTICFPEKWAINTDYEPALLVGAGMIGNASRSNFGKIWTGWTRIYPLGRGGERDDVDNAGDIIRTRQLARLGGSATCSGDSGSPLVQYVNGRAVVIGINSGSWIDDTEKWPSDNGCGHEHSESIFARISRFIDWIEEIIRKGDEWAAKDYPHEK